jgi:hypothetical protein
VREPFEYDQIQYNEVVYFLENKWARKLNEHEIHILLEGYKFGRLVEMEN